MGATTSVARTRSDRRLELSGRHPPLLDRAQRRVELLRRRVRDAAHDVAEIELVALRDVLDHAGGHGVPLERVPEGALALLQVAIDEQPEDRSQEEDGYEHEGEHGDDPARSFARVSQAVKQREKPRRLDLDSPRPPRYGTAMTRRTRASLVVGAALLLGTADACRQPGPTYEYEEPETTITTTPPLGRAVTTSTVAPKSPTWKRGEAR